MVHESPGARGLTPEAAPTFDLQSHSLHSDGALAPSGVVASAASAGVRLLALSDHDSVDGLDEALQAASQHGVRLVPAAEITTLDDGRDLHILGYLIDHHDRTLAEHLRSSRADREARATSMKQALHALGFALEERLLRQRASEGKSIGRPHLAQAVVLHPANGARLKEEGLMDASAFLEAYLIEGRPAFRSRSGPSVNEAIDWVHASGGLAVWAHPFFDVERPMDVLGAIDRFRATGLDGVECFYPTHDREQTELLVEHCAASGLLVTGSSDFHGPEHPHFSRFRAFSTFGREPTLGPIAEV